MEPIPANEPTESADSVQAEETEPSEKSLEDILVTDFHLSFRFSQGSPDVQNNIFELLLGYYTDVLGIDYEKIIDSLKSEEVTSRIMELVPPKKHLEIPDNSVEIALKDEYIIFLDMAQKKSPNLYTSNKVNRLIGDMMQRDLEYQQKSERPRPDGYRADRHASMFRDFVILAKPTASESFNAIFKRMREMLDALPPLMSEQLKQAWEANHPGEKFVPYHLRRMH
ncbi:MAG: hypothetical protein QG675_464 [Patescibacteria group bacterium]|jgi:hypothetical protein|nr:hypothetical protein [Patescibacteria group bacterium]